MDHFHFMGGSTNEELEKSYDIMYQVNEEYIQ